MKNRFRRDVSDSSWTAPPSGFIRVGSISVLVAVVLAGTLLSGGTITGVRLGVHPDHTRVVFDCRGPVQAGDPFVDPQGMILVAFPGAQIDMGRTVQPIRGFAVTAVEVIEWPSMPVAKIQVKSPLRQVRIFRLASPDRVVLDLFTEEDSNPGVPSNAPLVLAMDPLRRSVDSSGGGRENVGHGLPGDTREASAGGSLLSWAGGDATRLQTTLLVTVVGLSGATLLLLWSFARRGRAFGPLDFAERGIPRASLRDLDARITDELLRLERMSNRSQIQ